MKMFAVLAGAVVMSLSACSDDDAPQVPAGAEIADNGTMTLPDNAASMPAAPTASGPGTAFGLTRQQLEDADLVDAANATLGEVERVETDAQGNVNGLVVETEGSGPDRKVLVPLDGLSAVAMGDDWNLRAPDLTRERMIAMPEIR